ncbi:hypothetical protein GBA52_015688 [Prunus armeniaca]|nr:hypothetical protein GBA52_015688 [Prunus armeniaca]
MEFLQGAGIRVSRSERLTSTTFVFLAPYAHLLRAAVSFEDLADFVVVVAVLATDVDDFLLRLTRSIIRLENARNAAFDLRAFIFAVFCFAGFGLRIGDGRLEVVGGGGY